MAESSPLRLFSADPGSSAKGWAVADCSFEDGPHVRMRQLSGLGLKTLVDDVCAAAQEHHVLLALDAPLRAFGGMQAPSSFESAGAAKGGRAWPFDVNPFSQRPCEHALSSKPTVVNDSLVARELAMAVGQLCGWDAECRMPGNLSFTSLHDGVSVMGYMSAPHAPTVRTFLEALEREAVSSDVAVGYDLEPGQRDVGCVSVHESHPAVALAFYAAQGADGFQPPILKYKPLPQHGTAFLLLAAAVATHLKTCHGVVLEESIRTDDELDALVGLLGLVEQAAGTGDFFGTARDGRFLVPRRKGARTYGQIWEDAAAALEKAGMGRDGGYSDGATGYARRVALGVSECQ